MRTYILELDSGYAIGVEYERIEPELGYHNGTGTHGGIRVHGAYVSLPDDKGNNVKVNILHFLISEGLADETSIEEEIEENVYG